MRSRLLLAVSLCAAVLSAPAADATCVDRVCTPVGPGTVSTERGTWDTCTYVKLSGPAPVGWPPPDHGAPYLFFRSKQWGNDYPRSWDYRVCDLNAADVVGTPLPPLDDAERTVRELVGLPPLG